MKFVHLHCHSENSLLDGVSTVGDWVKRAKELGMPAIAITDHGNLNGAQQLLFACKQEGIKPIIGCEAYIVSDMAIKKHKEYRNHITLIAKNTEGYHNLIRLISQANIDGFYKKPRIDFGLLKQYSKGLIVLSGCSAGTLYKAISKNKKNTAIANINRYREIFKDDYYVELMLLPKKDFKEVYPKVVSIATQMGIQLVLTNDCHYLYNKDSLLQDILFMVKKKITKADNKKGDKKSFKFTLRCLWLKTPEELFKTWREHYSQTIPKELLKQAIENTVNIANKVEEYHIDKSHKYPAILVNGKRANKKDIDQLLKKKVIRGWKEHSLDVKKNKDYYDRLRYELKIIISKGMAAYFLILADVVRWAKENDILVGYGRGSVAGCLLAYLLRIHNVDPIKHQLLFERFINESSDSMPDIDVDFDARYRDKVKSYLIQKYGEDKVGEIATYGMMKLKMAIKDVARVYGFDYHFINEITKQLNDDDMTKEEIKAITGDLGNKEIIIDLALRMHGQTRHISIHPAGLVVTPTKLTDYVPLQRYRGKIITGWTEGVYRREITSLGLVKYDILGLKTLSIVSDCIKLINKRHNKKIDMDNIPLEDAEVFKNYRRDLNIGIFQCDTSTMRGLIRKMKPKEFNDITILLAMDRPPPLKLGIFDKFLNQRKDINISKKFNPVVWSILAETSGVLLYQEQVLKLVGELGRFNSEQRLKIKKLLKKPPKGKAEREAFRKTQIELGHLFISNAEKVIEKVEAERLWDNIKAYGEYGFNKSHSCSYALLSYATMWLKTYYPLEFYTALFNHTSDENKLASYRKELSRMNIEVLSIDINKSKVEFTIENKNIRYGFKFLKGIGKASDLIVRRQPYPNEEMFLNYAMENRSALNKRVVLALIKSGAFDVFCHRGEVLHKYNQRANKKYIGKPIKLNLFQKLEGEKDVYGYYFSGNLFKLIREQVGKDYINLQEALKRKVGERVKFFAKVESVRTTQKAIFINLICDNVKSVLIGWRNSIDKFKDVAGAEDVIKVDAYRMNYKGKKEFLIKENSTVTLIGG